MPRQHCLPMVTSQGGGTALPAVVGGRHAAAHAGQPVSAAI